ncbi:MAG: hypothetical protein C4582_07645, partial [Desulfobacteraceae bacterium]
KELIIEACRTLKALGERLPFELRGGDEPLRIEDPETIKAAAGEVRRYLMRRVLSAGVEP